MTSADDALEAAIALDTAMAEGFQASITAAERALFLLKQHGADDETVEKAYRGLALAREAGNLLEHNARLMRRPVLLPCGHADADACAEDVCDGTPETPRRRATLAEKCVCPWCGKHFTQLLPGEPPCCNLCRRPLLIIFGGEGVEVRKPSVVVHHLHEGRTDCDWSDRFGVPGNWPRPKDNITGTHHLWSAIWSDVTCVICISKRPP